VPPPPSRRIPPLALAVVALVVGGLVVGAVVLGGRDPDQQTLSGPDGEESVTTTTAPETPSTSADSTSPSTVATVPTGIADWPLVEDPGGAYRMSLPPSLIYTVVFGDLTGLGSTMFPDDETARALMDQIAGMSLNGPQTRLVAVDPQKLTGDQLPADLVELQGETGFEVLTVDDVAVRYEQVVGERQATTGSGIVNHGRLVGPAGEIPWYDIGGNDQIVRSRQYLIKAGDWLWTLTCWVADFESTRALTDQIAQSFQPL
jgi:hypothetical protein